MGKLLVVILTLSACTGEYESTDPDAGSGTLIYARESWPMKIKSTPPNYCEAWDELPYCAELHCVGERAPMRVCGAEEFCDGEECQTLYTCVCR